MAHIGILQRSVSVATNALWLALSFSVAWWLILTAGARLIGPQCRSVSLQAEDIARVLKGRVPG